MIFHVPNNGIGVSAHIAVFTSYSRQLTLKSLTPGHTANSILGKVAVAVWEEGGPSKRLKKSVILPAIVL